jgi:hypothetical protein
MTLWTLKNVIIARVKATLHPTSVPQQRRGHSDHCQVETPSEQERRDQDSICSWSPFLGKRRAERGLSSCGSQQLPVHSDHCQVETPSEQEQERQGEFFYSSSPLLLFRKRRAEPVICSEEAVLQRDALHPRQQRARVDERSPSSDRAIPIVARLQPLQNRSRRDQENSICSWSPFLLFLKASR